MYPATWLQSCNFSLTMHQQPNQIVPDMASSFGISLFLKSYTPEQPHLHVVFPQPFTPFYLSTKALSWISTADSHCPICNCLQALSCSQNQKTDMPKYVIAISLSSMSVPVIMSHRGHYAHSLPVTIPLHLAQCPQLPYPPLGHLSGKDAWSSNENPRNVLFCISFFSSPPLLPLVL